jgi:hypothetical protein
MYRLIILLVLFCLGTICFAQENVEENNNSRLIFMPIFSYNLLSFENVKLHTPTAGLSLIKANALSQELFSISAIYNMNIVNGIQSDYKNIYHNVIMSVQEKIKRHSIIGAFIATTDKPLYGGLHTFNGIASYSYDLINGEHFSMDLGGSLIFIDIGINLPDGTPWLIWPLPSVSLQWEYEWVGFNILPGIQLTIAPRKPVSFILSRKSHEFDASLWFSRFMKDRPETEIFGLGIGVKNASSEVVSADGDTYGINYYSVYGSLRILRFFQINGGWAIGGKERYGKKNWENLLENYGYSNDFDYNQSIGNGFFFSVSARIMF